MNGGGAAWCLPSVCPSWVVSGTKLKNFIDTTPTILESSLFLFVSFPWLQFRNLSSQFRLKLGLREGFVSWELAFSPNFHTQQPSPKVEPSRKFFCWCFHGCQLNFTSNVTHTSPMLWLYVLFCGHSCYEGMEGRVEFCVWCVSIRDTSTVIGALSCLIKSQPLIWGEDG